MSQICSTLSGVWKSNSSPPDDELVVVRSTCSKSDSSAIGRVTYKDGSTNEVFELRAEYNRTWRDVFFGHRRVYLLASSKAHGDRGDVLGLIETTKLAWPANEVVITPVKPLHTIIGSSGRMQLPFDHKIVTAAKFLVSSIQTARRNSSDSHSRVRRCSR